MIPPLTFDQAVELLAGRVDQAWLDELRSTPEGAVVLGLVIDAFVALDERDAGRASAQFVAPHSAQVAPPASGPLYATTTLALTLRRALKTTRSFTLPARTAVQTPDGHVFRTNGALTWGLGEVGVTKTVTATAALPGPLTIPPGNLTLFAQEAAGLSGSGLSVSLLPGGLTQPKALRLRTDTAVPHSFRPEMIGSYVELTECGASGVANEGRALQVATVNDSASDPLAAGASEGEYAWGALTTTSLDAWLAPWATGTFAFSWRVVGWGELLAVTNTTAAVGGALGLLDELAQSRGRPRQDGEGDEQVRARLRRAPSPPTPLGALRAALVALAPWSFGRRDVKIYEMGLPGAAPEDPYAFNFPVAMGFVGDLHTGDMDSPETPDGMASVDENYAPLDSFFNPGLALLESGSTRFAAVVRWDAPAGMPADSVAAVRRSLFTALDFAKPPGCLVQLYHPEQWSYPAT